MESFEATTSASMDDAEAMIRSALKDQGFGVLTEIDIAATFKEKLGIERTPMKVLGACNPNFAYQALSLDASASLVLPCNVVLEEVAGGTHVSIVDPRALMPGDQMADLAKDAAQRLMAVIAVVQEA